MTRMPPIPHVVERINAEVDDLKDQVLTDAKETTKLPFALVGRSGRDFVRSFDDEIDIATYVSMDIQAKSVEEVDRLYEQCMAALRGGGRLLPGSRDSEDQTDDPPPRQQKAGEIGEDKVVSRIRVLRIET